MPPSDSDPTPPAGSAAAAALPERPILRSLMLGLALAWAGVLISVLLLERHAGIRAFLCPAQGGCESVLASKFASIRGLPLPVLGVAFYFSVLVLLLVVYASSRKAFRLLLLDGALWMTVVGLTFSVGLMYVQFAVLHAFCSLCTASALVMAALLGVLVRTARGMAAKDCGSSPAGALTLFIFALLPTAILLTLGLAAPDPAGRRSWVDLSTAQIAGPREARVQLVVFSDFECQFCRQLAPIVKRIRTEFPEQVMVAFRYFPLEGHPRAFPAAVAAECAGEQGQFWEYHDRLFADGIDLSDAGLLQLATTLGLDRERFSQCLREEGARRRVEESRNDAIKSGLEGVPVVFLNGRRVRNALDYDLLVREIRELLPPAPRP